jgi:hypothetical protein
VKIEQVSLAIIRTTKQFTTCQAVIDASNVVIMILQSTEGLYSFLFYLCQVIHAPYFYRGVVTTTYQSVARLWDKHNLVYPIGMTVEIR